MTYEEIWQRVKDMSQRNRKMLAYEMTLSGYNVGYIHPHYYFDAKGVHDILFYPPHSQSEIEDKDFTYYNDLKGIIENDREIHIRVKRYVWLPRFINDWREKNFASSYICSRFNGEGLNKYYMILPGEDISGGRMRILYLWDGDGGEVVYKMTACKNYGSTEYMTFEKNEK